MNRVILAAPRVAPRIATRYALSTLFKFNFEFKIFRSLADSAQTRDIDTAAKFIGAGAATVGVAGSGAGKLNIIFSFILVL